MADELNFYDAQGMAVCYVDDGEHLYAFTGEAIAYLEGDRVYSYSGRFLGWFEDGWLFDQENRPLFHSEEAVGGPLKPLRELRPMKELRGLRPLKGLREMPSLRPLRGGSWSPLKLNDWLEE